MTDSIKVPGNLAALQTKRNEAKITNEKLAIGGTLHSEALTKTSNARAALENPSLANEVIQVVSAFRKEYPQLNPDDGAVAAAFSKDVADVFIDSIPSSRDDYFSKAIKGMLRMRVQQQVEKLVRDPGQSWDKVALALKDLPERMKGDISSIEKDVEFGYCLLKGGGEISRDNLPATTPWRHFVADQAHHQTFDGIKVRAPMRHP